MPLITSTQLLLAPCSFCQRKPGFFANGKNYCYVHWYNKSLDSVKLSSNITTAKEKKDVML